MWKRRLTAINFKQHIYIDRIYRRTYDFILEFCNSFNNPPLSLSSLRKIIRNSKLDLFFSNEKEQHNNNNNSNNKNHYI